MTRQSLFAATAFLLVGSVAYAVSPGNSGTLQLTGTVDGSILLTFATHAGGADAVLTGTGTAIASTAFGVVSYYSPADGTLGNKFVKASDGTGFTLTTHFDVVVAEANLPTSTGYTLTAQLAAPDASGVLWSVGGFAVTDSPAVQITAAGSYGATSTALIVSVPKTADASTPIAVSDTINFAAVAN